jgi:6-phosphofructokinase 2
LFDAGGGGINVSKAISRLEGKSLAVITGRIDREMLKKLYKKNQFLLKPLKRRWDRNFVAVDDIRILSFVLFSVTTLQSLKR